MDKNFPKCKECEKALGLERIYYTYDGPAVMCPDCVSLTYLKYDKQESPVVDVEVKEKSKNENEPITVLREFLEGMGKQNGS